MGIGKLVKDKHYPQMTWEFLNRIFTIEYFRFFLFGFTVTPIFVNFIDLINKKSCGLSGVSANNICIISSGLSLPFSWEAMWIASIIYLIAYVVYLLFCPPFIRKYKNIENYISKALPNRNIAHEWLEFIRKNKEILIDNNDFFQKLRDSSFNSRVNIEINTKKDLEELYIKEFINENKSGILISSNNSFTIYGNFEGKTLIFNYNPDSKSSDIQISENYKEIVLSLFDINEKTKTISKVICYILLIFSFFFFLIILYQNISKTFEYILLSIFVS
ncbi:hypothetical protein [Acetobacter papayae]|uniref:hypothetical protein n=1 Tax=Acetobacter papayae TaxID=1076592 RepID=UPI0011DD47BB|nr:hypothetical protein [Acetobacter papayae]